ncbi:hypothetical protein VNO78_23120 [Psophocarpus tetragonolobus]|uniref:Uncharacterized protein n=1 Tax=Psophocarpus tetragonolobus TaxID=3891 RepID=A0AAN9XDQ0_PSOTE
MWVIHMGPRDLAAQTWNTDITTQPFLKRECPDISISMLSLGFMVEVQSVSRGPIEQTPYDSSLRDSFVTRKNEIVGPSPNTSTNNFNIINDDDIKTEIE